jgi:hypothetical protein
MADPATSWRDRDKTARRYCPIGVRSRTLSGPHFRKGVSSAAFRRSKGGKVFDDNKRAVYFDANEGQVSTPQLSQSPGNCAACNGSAASSGSGGTISKPKVAPEALGFDPEEMVKEMTERLRGELEPA